MSNTDNLYDALERCAATTSKKEKLAIVKTLGEFTPWLKAALDPTVAYFIAKLPTKWDKSGADQLNEHDLKMLSQLADRTLSGGDAQRRIADTMADLTPKSQELLRRVILKDLRCSVGVTMTNEAFRGLLPVFPYQRCVLEKDSNMGKWNWGDGIYVQLKADGMFANANIEGPNDVRVFSRQGSPFPPGSLGGSVGSLERQLALLPKGHQYHGELLVWIDDVHGAQLLERQIGNGILNSVLAGGALPPNHYVTYDVWDQIPLACAVDKGRYEVPYKQRLAALDKAVAEATDGLLAVIDSTVVHSRAEAMAVYAKYLKQGLEGVICKHPAAHWRDGDNKDQVKLKLEVPVDLKVVGFRDGTPGTRTEATFGAVVCRTADDLLEVGVHGFKRETEQYIHEHREELLGTVMTVLANGVMAPSGEQSVYSLFLPRFVELRRDKSAADTLQRVKDQFEAAVAA